MRRLVLVFLTVFLAVLAVRPVDARFTITRASRVVFSNAASFPIGGGVSCPSQSHTAGNLLVLETFAQISGGVTPAFPLVISNTAGDTWHQAGSNFSSGPNGMATWYAYNTAGNASDVVTVTSWGIGVTNLQFAAMVCLEFSGFGSSDPYESGSQTAANGTGTALDSGNVVISGTNDAIVALFEDDGDSLTNATYNLTPFNFTGIATNFMADGYHVVTASEHATATGSNNNWMAYASAFKASGGGGAVLPAAIIGNPRCCSVEWWKKFLGVTF